MKLSDYIIQVIKSKVKDVFILAGGGCIHLIDSLANYPQLKYICMQHEQSLTMAVEGYSRISGFGVGIVNTGCRQVGDQEINIIELIKSITKYAITITDPKTVRYHLEKAIWLAKEGRQGPVWIDIPLDIQATDIIPDSLMNFESENPLILANNDSMCKIIHALKVAKRPLLIIGSGVNQARNELQNLLDSIKIPAMTGCHSGIDILQSNYDLHMGRFGILGQIYSNQIIQECDLLLAIGSRLSVKITGYDYKEFAKNAYKILVDIDPYEMNKNNIIANLKIQADAKCFLNQLIKCDLTLDIDEWRDKCISKRSQYNTLHPKFIESKVLSSYFFTHKLNEIVANTIPIITSNGTSHVTTMPIIPCNRKMFTNVGSASMGWGLPAAIGACFAQNKQPIICIEGDSSIHMVIYELQTVYHHNLPIKIFVINNKGYGSIKQTQNNLFKRLVGSTKTTGFSLPALQKLATAYNIEYLSCGKNVDVCKIINQSLKISGPVICELFVSPDEMFEPRVKTVIINGKFVPPTLNQSQYENINNGW